MDQCVSPVFSLVVPIVLLNFVATTLAVIAGRYADRILWTSQSESSEEDSSCESSSEDSDITDEDEPDSPVSDADIIAEVRKSAAEEISPQPQPKSEALPEGLAEALPVEADQPLLTKTLVDVVEQVSQALSQDVNVSAEKKLAFANVLKDIPDLIKMAGTNNGELQVILKQKVAEMATLSDQNEGEFLMKTLDSLQ